MQEQKLRIVFAGGGTGGHLFPAIAIANEVRKNAPHAQITFVGTRKKIEARVVPQNGFGFKAIWVSGLRRSFTLGNVLFPVKFLVAIVQSFFLMWKLKPAVVVGTGGYVSGPPLFAAITLGIPTLIQEQNSYPGITTRLLASRVDEVHLTFESSQRYLKRNDNVQISGNPTRERVGTILREDGAAYFEIDHRRWTLLVFGGSLGASSINNAMLRVLPRISAGGFQIIWQTGELDFGRVKAECGQMLQATTIRVNTFIDKMEYAYAACDLAVCRAGATTVAELAKAGVASVLVPYPYAAADHQTDNARAMVETGAAVMVRDAELNEKLLPTIEGLLGDTERLQNMKRAAAHFGHLDATATLARAVLDLAGGTHGRA